MHFTPKSFIRGTSGSDDGNHAAQTIARQPDTPPVDAVIRGRSPGSRVKTFVSPSQGTGPQWLYPTNAHRSQLRGQPRLDKHHICRPDSHLSLQFLRISGTSNTIY